MERKQAVGGRLLTWHDPDHRIAAIEHEEGQPHRIELGGAIFHWCNETMVELARACGVSMREPARPEAKHTEAEVYGTLPEVGVWDEAERAWALRAGGSLWAAARLLWRYGWDLVRVSRHANAVKELLRRMYEGQRASPLQPYCRSVEEMLERSGLGSWAQRDFGSLGYAPRFVAECLDPISRTIYSRGASSVNGYCGLAAVIAADGGGLFSCPAGNSTLVRSLLEASGASLELNCWVKSLGPASDGGWAVHLAGAAEARRFDAVVLACPWEHGLELLGDLGADLPRRPYRQMVVTLVAGEPALAGGSTPQTVLTCGPGEHEGTFYSMGAVASAADGGRDVWKIFSAEALSTDSLGVLFRPGYEVLVTHPWLHCFPDLAPQLRFPPMELAKGCYFANAMEALAPSMEAAAWCGKNVALMLAQDILAVMAAGDEGPACETRAS